MSQCRPLANIFNAELNKFSAKSNREQIVISPYSTRQFLRDFRRSGIYVRHNIPSSCRA
ncbi:hypothetical protein [Alysiella crassa]|uniref:hypothetical protein n=1 Tax=Alysiella crassa TaxID=153491 RepID=UPI0012EC7B00|nr:hypothetical protein [Alysiella crassa]UOP06416.1 hypothetical protein LVJ80_11645 [Alysiella crassa]